MSSKTTYHCDYCQEKILPGKGVGFNGVDEVVLNVAKKHLCDECVITLEDALYGLCQSTSNRIAAVRKTLTR